jgi:hypothetical protein
MIPSDSLGALATVVHQWGAMPIPLPRGMNRSPVSARRRRDLRPLRPLAERAITIGREP